MHHSAHVVDFYQKLQYNMKYITAVLGFAQNVLVCSMLQKTRVLLLLILQLLVTTGQKMKLKTNIMVLFTGIGIGIIGCLCFGGSKPNIGEISENFIKIVTNDKSRTHDLIHVQYTKKNDYLLLGAEKGWEHRIISDIELFVKAFNLIRDEVDSDFSLDIESGDYSKDPNVLAYAYRDVVGKYQIPDFSFADWPEVGIINYDNTCKEIEEAGKKPYIYNKMFWIGNATTNKIREKLVKMGENNENFEFIGMGWTPASKEGQLKRQKATKYVSLPDHTQYKYLIDVPGVGYSARVKLLLFSGRPLFYVIRSENESYFKDLKPFKHYIPVRADLSDLEEKYQWAEKNPDVARQIAQNALEYAKNNLTTRAAVFRYSDVILQYIKDYKQEQSEKQKKHPKFLPQGTKRF